MSRRPKIGSTWTRQELRWTECDNCRMPLAEHYARVVGSGVILSCERCWVGLQLVLLRLLDDVPGVRISLCEC